MPVTTGTTTGTSASSGGGSKGGGGQGGSSGSNPGLTTGYVGPAGTNRGAWSGDGQYLGLTTGPTIYGNTAFGPAGGFATGYATRDQASLAAAGMGPTPGTYSNFMTPGGRPMFGNSPMQGASAVGFPNANAAYNYMNQQYQNWLANRPKVAGLLAEQGVPTPRPAAPPVTPPVPWNPAVPEEVVPGYRPPPSGYYPGAYWGGNGVYSGVNRPPSYSPPNVSTTPQNNQGGNPLNSGGSGWGPSGNPEGGYGAGGARYSY